MFFFVPLSITLLIVIYTFFKIRFSYWKRKQVPYIEPTIPYGTLENPFRRKHVPAVYFKKQYDEFKSKGHKGGGIYFLSSFAYLSADPEYNKNIMTKDFQNFSSRGLYLNEMDDMLSTNLLTLSGDRWKALRSKFTPTFTATKMKIMFKTIEIISNQLVDEMSKLPQKNLEIKNVLEMFTIDIIGSCAFGIDCNSFSKNENKFLEMGRTPLLPWSKLKTLKFLFTNANHRMSKFLRLKTFDSEINNFFLNLTKETVSYRNENNVVRNDFMQILINLTTGNNNKGEDVLTVEEITAQLFLFFLAGYDTSSTTMTFALYELALNTEMQEMARREVLDIYEKYNGELTYEALNELVYMEKILSETLRKYPIIAFVSRICAETYKMPDSDLVFDKGTRITIPIYAFHHDPEYFPEPDKFDPERFNEENKSTIKPYAYMPFGGGPRICIGARFGIMQSKMGIAAVLKNFRIVLSEKTSVPLVMDPFSFLLSPKDGVWLNLEKISDVGN